MTQEVPPIRTHGSNALQEALIKLQAKSNFAGASDAPASNETCPKCGFTCRSGEMLCPNCFSVIVRDEAYQAGSTNRLPAQEPETAAAPVMPQRSQIILTMTESGSSLTLPRKESLVIGRYSTDDGDFQPDVDLTMFDALKKGVSRRHLQLSRKEALVYVTDLGSTNGTFVNGHRLMPNLQRVLRNGDELRFGYLKVKINF